MSGAVRDRELPDSLPLFRSLHVAEDDRIWVERWPPEGEADRRFFEVYGSDGGFDRAVVLPVPLAGDPPPFFTEDAVFGVLRDSDTGVERVVKLTFSADAGSF